MNSDYIIDCFKKEILQDFHISQEDWARTKSNLEVVTFKKGEFVDLGTGKSMEMVYIVDGCMRMFNYNSEMEETLDFCLNKEFCGDPVGCFSGRTLMHYGFQAMTNSTAIIIPIKLIAANSFKDNTGVCRQLEQFIMRKKVEKLQTQLFKLKTEKDVTSRYLDLMKLDVRVMKSIPQKHIATFLGIYPESLSRLRKQLTSKGMIRN